MVSKILFTKVNNTHHGILCKELDEITVQKLFAFQRL